MIAANNQVLDARDTIPINEEPPGPRPFFSSVDWQARMFRADRLPLRLVLAERSG